MTIYRSWRRAIAIPTAIMTLWMVLPYGAAKAEMVSTEVFLSTPSSPTHAATDPRARLMGLLGRADVRAEMQALGVDPQEAIARVRVMSDREIDQLAGRLDASPAGSSIVGPIVGAVVFVFLVLLLTDIFCLTSIFPFTKCIDTEKS